MTLFESFRIAFEALRANKMRSFLTMLGIIIGVAAVIAVIAVGHGGKAMIIKQIEGMGSGLVWIQPKYNPDQRDFTKLAYFKPADLRPLREGVPGIKDLTPQIDTNASVKYQSNALNISASGTSEGYQTVRSVKIDRGRFFTKAEVDGSARVAVIGAGIREKFFGEETGIGKIIHINNTPYEVIGVLNQDTSLLGKSGDSANGKYTLYIPYTTATRLTGNDRIYAVFVSPETPEKTKEVREALQRVADRLYGEGKFEAMSLDQVVSAISSVTGIMTSVIAGIAGIALLVGGIGIMNIMLVSVTERTREIGIRKALGARRRDLLWQFLIEAMVLSVIGGSLGIALGAGLAALVSALIKVPPLVPLWAVVVAFGFSALVGMIFGVYPANKASRLDPIEALRYE